jgi:hypothetical protein
VDLSDNPRLTTFLERTREASIAVSDFRRPIQREVLDALEVGSILVNYVRSSRRGAPEALATDLGIGRAGSPPSATADLAMRQETHADSGWPDESLMTLAQSDVGHRHGVAEPWARRDAFAGAKALSTAGRSSDGKLRAGMSRLPLRLQPHFTRDLHIGVLEADRGLTVQATTRKGGLDPAGIVAMMSNVVSILDAFGSSENARVSNLIG